MTAAAASATVVTKAVNAEARHTGTGSASALAGFDCVEDAEDVKEVLRVWFMMR
jgi:hypothetical protein